MLKNTFQHIPGVGEKRERQLWSCGCRSWDDFVCNDYGLSDEVCLKIKAGVLESGARLKSFDNSYFKNLLPSAITWRAYPEFKEHACFIDIETTGLAPPYSHVTTVCVHSKEETRTFIRDKNLGELGAYLEQFKYVVSFNGARFDLPFLSGELGIRFDQIHLDLVYPFRRLGLRGGLKRIEQLLGVSRGTDGVTGWDAVRLWRSYRSGKTIEVAGNSVSGEAALDLLVEYNREDTVNLEALTDFVLSEMKRTSGFNE